jgi:hypothetical protein
MLQKMVVFFKFGTPKRGINRYSLEVSAKPNNKTETE